MLSYLNTRWPPGPLVRWPALVWYILVRMRRLVMEIVENMAAPREARDPGRPRRRAAYIRAAIRRAQWDGSRETQQDREIERPDDEEGRASPPDLCRSARLSWEALHPGATDLGSAHHGQPRGRYSRVGNPRRVSPAEPRGHSRGARIRRRDD